MTIVSVSTTSITVNWTYGNISDADGYVVYFNYSTVHNIIGSNNTSVTLDGLIPGASYSITVRAYQDILGLPSATLILVAPSPPTIVIKQPNSLKVTWKATPSTKGYVVAYSNSTGNYTQQVPTNAATISPVTLGSTYCISVYGYYNLSAKESDFICIIYGGLFTLN